MAIKRDKVIANAEKLVAKGKIEPAIKEYERLLADSPGDVNTLNRIGDLWVRINRIDEAVRVFREIADRYSKDGFFLKAIAIYKKINKLDPSKLEVYGELAELYAKQGLAMEAKSQYQILADYYLKQGESHNALGVYQKIAELDPNSINVHVKLADLYSQLGKVTEALAEYDRVGKMLMKRGMLDEALQVFRKALKIDPRNVDLAASLVDTLLEARDFDNAISLLESTLETNSGNAKLIAQLGRTHLMQNDRASAKRVLVGGVRQNPTDVALRVALCELYLKESSPDEALSVLGPVADSLASKGDAKSIELLNKIIAVEPLHTPTLAKVVDVYKALKRETNVLASLNSLAEAYIAVQDLENASVTLQELIGREPQNAQHKDKLAFVRKSLGTEGGEAREAPSEVSAEFEMPSETTDFAMGELPDIDVETDLAEVSTLDFGEPPTDEELPELAAETTLDFGELSTDEGGPAEGGEDVDFITEHLTEAEVFAKYGLAEKAIEHLEMILGRSPDQLDANERLVRILLDEGLRERACERAAHLLGVYQRAGDDGAFDKWYNELVGKGFAVSPGPPVEVELIEGSAPRRAAPPVPAAVPAVSEEPAIEEEAEVTLDFDDLPDVEVEVEEPELVVTEGMPAEPVLEEEEVSLDFEEPEAEEEPAEEPVPELPEVEEIAELEFEEETESVELLAEEDEEEIAELDFGEEEAAELPEIAERSTPGFEEPEEEGESIEEVPELPQLEELAALDFEEEAEVSGLEFEEEEPASLELEEPVSSEPEIVPEPLSELPPLDAGAQELDFGMAESTALGGPPIEEIGELDFYIEQELFDEARTKLETLLAQFPGSEDLAERMAAIEKATAPPPPETVPLPRFSPEDIESELLAAIPDDDEDIEIHATALAEAPEPVIDEGDLFAGEDDFFDLAAELEDELLADEEPISLAEEEQSLADIFREFKKGVEQQLDSEDYDTHYNLGIAYKEMGLIDEAIGEFQVASKDPARVIECCSMLGLCFLEKGMPQLAIKWYKKGLESPEITEDENLGLLYDLGTAYLESGDTAAAQKAFMEVYGINSNYREIVGKIKQIEESKK
jgi:pilus assembly protein FimV